MVESADAVRDLALRKELYDIASGAQHTACIISLSPAADHRKTEKITVKTEHFLIFLITAAL